MSAIRDRSAVIMAAAIGFVVTVGYAIAGSLQILVWNPLAAVPGATLSEIEQGLARASESLGTSLVIGWAIIGGVLAAGILIAAVLRLSVRLPQVVQADLVLLVLAAPTFWAASFPAGMGIADTFHTTGAPHSPWGAPLYAVSAAALLALLVMVAVAQRRATAEAQDSTYERV
ncbi:hypothetical protein [Diaminobutyricimonas sp. LJ205]|uniref:hypothetical protein n=1 Tax=Diaminobutyricimonas sp. LJ205 TaxID=2683590 RepID=UPI001E2FD5E8|nr:hypothetical protein [Diaminobutyricimonas sp. LJ205]